MGLHLSGTKSCKESLSTFVWYEELSWQDFARPVCSHAIGGHVVVRPIQGIKHVGLHLSGTKSHERRACPHPSGTRNQAGWTSSIRFEESSMQDFVHQVRSRMKGGLVLIRLVRGISRLHFNHPVRSHTKGELVHSRPVCGNK